MISTSFSYSEDIDEKFHLLSFDRSSTARRRMEAILYHIRVFVSKRNEGDRFLIEAARKSLRHPHFDDSSTKQNRSVTWTNLYFCIRSVENSLISRISGG